MQSMLAVGLNSITPGKVEPESGWVGGSALPHMLIKAVRGALGRLRRGLGWPSIASCAQGGFRGGGTGLFFPGSLGFRRVLPGSSRVPFFTEFFCFQLLLGFVWKKPLFPEFRYSLCSPRRWSGDSGNAFPRADLAPLRRAALIDAGVRTRLLMITTILTLNIEELTSDYCKIF